MSGTPPGEILRSRLKAFLIFSKSKLLSDGADLDRLPQLRRLSDVRGGGRAGPRARRAETASARDRQAAGRSARPLEHPRGDPEDPRPPPSARPAARPGVRRDREAFGAGLLLPSPGEHPGVRARD